MKKYVFTVSICLILLALSQCCGIVPDFSQKAAVCSFLKSLGEVAKLALALLLGGTLIFEKVILEHIRPLLSDYGRKTVEEVGKSIRDGMTSVSDKVSEAIKQSSPLRSSEQADTELSNNVPDNIRRLVREGKTKEALALASKNGDTLTVLVLSQEEKDWKKAYELLRKDRTHDPKYYSLLAYKFWNANELTIAIELAEIGLNIALECNDSSFVIGRLKNSIAYYYAQSGDLKYRKQAFKYVEEAKDLIPQEKMSVLDTEGFVKIAFGDKQEVDEGVELITELAKHMKMYGKSFYLAMELAKRRFEEFNR
jgi:tetratricopeptide (TPR) repeat protein